MFVVVSEGFLLFGPFACDNEAEALLGVEAL